jgi:hypothetical protein
MGQIASAVLAQPCLHRPHMHTRPLYGPGLVRRFVRREPGTHRSERRTSGILEEVIPVLRVSDAAAAAAWYQRLGFAQEWEFRFEPGFPASWRPSPLPACA